MHRRLPPTQFFVRGRLWRLTYGDPSERRLVSKKEWGACVQSEQRIYLNPTLRLKKNEKLLWQKFTHEIMHAYKVDTHTRDRKHLSVCSAEDHEAALGEFMYENHFFWLEQALQKRRDELEKLNEEESKDGKVHVG